MRDCAIVLETADVVPIPKSNPPWSIGSDLRPISLTPVLSKQSESFVGNWILETISGKIDVNHAILLDRFRELEVHPILISWLHSFLHERQQRVKIGDEVPSWLTMKDAVPQGS